MGTKVEVKSADEAANILFKGQKRRRVVNTTLNANELAAPPYSIFVSFRPH